jgi:hypothetical protein
LGLAGRCVERPGVFEHTDDENILEGGTRSNPPPVDAQAIQ